MSKDEPLQVIVARIDENVKGIIKTQEEDRDAFVAHVKKDEDIVQMYIKPLWEDRLQDIGAAKQKVASAEGTAKKTGTLDRILNTGIAAATAYAAIKLLK